MWDQEKEAAAPVEPSVKGVLVVGAVVVMRRHREAGRISPEQLEARLSPAALELIDAKIEIGRWYPIAHFVELIDLDWELAANRDPEHVRSAGAVSADKLSDRGLYQQLDYAERTTRAQNRQALIRQARLISTVTGSFYNFLDVEVRVNDDSLEILYSNAEPFTEVLRYTTEGFMNQINHRQGSPRRWTSERVRPDLVAYRLALPSRLAGEG